MNEFNRVSQIFWTSVISTNQFWPFSEMQINKILNKVWSLSHCIWALFFDNRFSLLSLFETDKSIKLFDGTKKYILNFVEFYVVFCSFDLSCFYANTDELVEKSQKNLCGMSKNCRDLVEQLFLLLFLLSFILLKFLLHKTAS